MAYLIDTNILVQLFHRRTPNHSIVQAAVDFLNSQSEVLYFAPQIAAEFWNVATRPSDKNGLGLNPSEAELLLQEIEQLFVLKRDAPATYVLWREVINTVKVSGVQVHDARLVAWMQTHSIDKILTFNTKDFQRYSQSTGITVMNPIDVSE